MPADQAGLKEYDSNRAGQGGVGDLLSEPVCLSTSGRTDAADFALSLKQSQAIENQAVSGQMTYWLITQRL